MRRTRAPSLRGVSRAAEGQCDDRVHLRAFRLQRRSDRGQIRGIVELHVRAEGVRDETIVVTEGKDRRRLAIAQARDAVLVRRSGIED